MFNPKYRILLKNECFPQDKFICLGSQFILIVNSIKDFLLSHSWYGADIDAIGKNVKKYGIKNTRLNLIGTDLQFIDYCSGIKQFIWGVFLCVDNNFLSENIQNIELETEDESFRPINGDGILIEIRTFDTSYFEIYAEDFDLIKRLANAYNVEIEKSKP